MLIGIHFGYAKSNKTKTWIKFVTVSEYQKSVEKVKNKIDNDEPRKTLEMFTCQLYIVINDISHAIGRRLLAECEDYEKMFLCLAQQERKYLKNSFQLAGVLETWLKWVLKVLKSDIEFDVDG